MVVALVVALVCGIKELNDYEDKKIINVWPADQIRVSRMRAYRC